MTYRLSEKLYK